jgi:hypothetical protein
MPILAQLASDHALDTAHEWLCRRRRDYSANSDVWAFRRDWARKREQIKGELLSGNYRFSLLTRITLKDGEDSQQWTRLLFDPRVRRTRFHIGRSCASSRSRRQG